MTISAIMVMTALVVGLGVLCAVLNTALQRHASMTWMAMALGIGVIESIALKDGNITELDLVLTAITVPLSYVCVSESVRSAYGRDRSSKQYFTAIGAMIAATLLLLQLPVPAVVQFLPSQLAGAFAMCRAVGCVYRERRFGDFIDIALLASLVCVTSVYAVRIPFFAILVGLETPFATFPRQQMQDVLIMVFAVLVPSVVFLTIARVVANALQLQRMRAEHDFLTDLPNRRAFEEFAGAGRCGTGSMIVCDIDHFKRINDTFGHAAGDEVIRAVASLIDGHGMAARIGGEEFAIWMPGATLLDARQHAESLRRELMSLQLVGLDDHQITASFGIAPCQPDVPLSEILSAADGALYLAKNQGRNRVVMLGENIEREGEASPGRKFRRAAA